MEQTQHAPTWDVIQTYLNQKEDLKKNEKRWATVTKWQKQTKKTKKKTFKSPEFEENI